MTTHIVLGLNMHLPEEVQPSKVVMVSIATVMGRTDVERAWHVVVLRFIVIMRGTPIGLLRSSGFRDTRVRIRFCLCMFVH